MSEVRLSLMEAAGEWANYDRVHTQQHGPDFERKLIEVVNLVTNKPGWASHVWEFRIKEAMTTSDFPYLFGEILDRQLLAGFKESVPVMQAVCRQGTVKDFRYKDIYDVYGGDERLSTYDKIAEKGEYKASDRTDSRYRYKVQKYGRQFDISWETLINDDLDALKDTGARFARAARRGEEYFMTTLFWDADGPLDAYFSAANGGAAVAATPLTIGNLETGVETMGAFTDAGGEPILNRPLTLMVGPALEFTGRQILTSANKMWLADSDDVTPPAAYPTTNVISKYGLKLLVNPYIPIVCTTGTIAQTTWALFSDPRECPAAEFGRLRGHETPEIFMKASDQVRVGGGAVSPMDGDFATDNIFYKVRHCFGGCTLRGQAGYASDGQ